MMELRVAFLAPWRGAWCNQPGLESGPPSGDRRVRIVQRPTIRHCRRRSNRSPRRQRPPSNKNSKKEPQSAEPTNAFFNESPRASRALESPASPPTAPGIPDQSELMILKYIYLHLNLDEYPASTSIPFGFRTRYICNYIERNIQPLKSQVVGFNRICIQGTSKTADNRTINHGKSIVPKVLFDQSIYESLNNDELHEFYLSMITEGLLKASIDHNIPLNQILNIIEEFRRDGYKNKWMFQKKKFPNHKIESELHCSLDTNRFTLSLTLSHDGNVFFNENIMETKPDEIIFLTRFKNVALENDCISALDKFGTEIFTTSALPSAMPLQAAR